MAQGRRWLGAPSWKDVSGLSGDKWSNWAEGPHPIHGLSFHHGPTVGWARSFRSPKEPAVEAATMSGYVAPAIRQKGIYPGATGEHMRRALSDVHRRNLKIRTPIGYQRSSVRAVLGDQAIEYAHFMARARSMEGVPTSRVRSHVLSKFKRQWWKQNLKEINLRTGQHLDLRFVPKDAHEPLRRIIDIAKQHGWGFEQRSQKLAGFDDIINTLTLKKGRKSIPIPVLGSTGRYAYTSTKEGIEGHILRDYIPSGRKRVSYLQGLANQLSAQARGKQLQSTGRTGFYDILKSILKNMEPAVAAATYTPGDMPLSMEAYAPGVVKSVEDFYSTLYKRRGLATEEAFEKLSKTYGYMMADTGPRAHRYSPAFQKPGHFLKGQVSRIQRRDMPFGSAGPINKPAYYRYGVAPIMSNMLEGAPVLGVETEFTLGKFLPYFQKGTTHEAWVRTMYITDPYVWQSFASGSEAALFSRELLKKFRTPGYSHKADATYLLAGKKISRLASVPRQMMGGADIIAGRMPSPSDFYRSMIGAGGYQAQQKGALGGYLKRLGEFGGFSAKAVEYEGKTRLVTEASDALDYARFLRHVNKVHEEMGIVTPLAEVSSVPGLEGKAFTMFSPLQRRALETEEGMLSRLRKFRPHVEWRHLQAHGQRDLAEFMMKKSAKAFYEVPEIQKSLMPFAGSGEAVGSAAREAGTLVQAKDLGDLSWLLDSNLSAAAAERTKDPFFRSVWEKGLTVELPEEIALSVGERAKGEVTDAISAHTRFYHIPALKSFQEELGLLMHPEAVSGVGIAREHQIYIQDMLKNLVHASEASKKWAAGDIRARTDFDMAMRAYGESVAAQTTKTGMFRKATERLLPHTASGQIKGAPGLSGVEFLDKIARYTQRAGQKTPGLGEIVVGPADIEKLGLGGFLKEGALTQDVYVMSQAYPGVAPGTTMPMKVVYQESMQEGLWSTHVADRLFGYRDLDRDTLTLLSDPNADFHEKMRQWHLSDRKNKQRVFDLFSDSMKQRKTGAAEAIADVVKSAAKASGSSHEDVLGLVQALYTTKALTGPTNAALAPYRMITRDVITGDNAAYMARATYDALAVVEQAAIQKGSGTSADILSYLSSITSKEQEAATVKQIDVLLKEHADSVVKGAWETAHGAEVGVLASDDAYRKAAAEGLYKVRMASQDAKYRGVWDFFGQIMGRRKGKTPRLLTMIEDMAKGPTAQPIEVIQQINRMMGKGEGAMMRMDPKKMISSLNAAVVDEGTEAAAKGLWGSIKALWTSSPAWSKIGIGVGAGLIGLSALRGAFGGGGPAPAMTIPPDRLMKELYGTQMGAPVPPNIIDVPQHGMYEPTQSPGMPAPARLRQDRRSYQIHAHGRNSGFMDPSALEGQFNSILSEHTDTDPTTKIYIDGPNEPDTRIEAMKRFNDMAESRFYA